MSNMTKRRTTQTQPAHEGPCRINLDLRIGGCHLQDGTPLTTRTLLDRAVVWAEGLTEFAGILALVAQATCECGEHPVSREQFDATQELLTEFAEYALACGYDTDFDADDRIIGQALISGDRISTWLYCDVPCEWTETTTVCRWGEDLAETRVYRAAAHV